MRATGPLFRFDPGWLFIIAGLVVCAAGVLLPAQADLRALEAQLALLQGEEARAYQRLAAHAEFIDQVDRNEPGIIKRLAAAQLNLVPKGDKPLLLASGETSPVTEWIDATVDLNLRPSVIEPVSTLSRWASGPSRLWMFGGGIMAVFIGLLISPDGSRSRRRRAGQPVVQPQAWTAYDGEDSTSPAAHAALWDNGDDDGDAEDPSVMRFRAEVIASLPATADLDPDHELLQQEDTVDLEEDELPARKRSVIDDNVAWHNAATVEHAGEVIIEASELSSAADSGALLRGEDESSNAAAQLLNPNDEAEAAEILSAADENRKESTTQGDAWLIDDATRMSEASLLLPDNVDAHVAAHGESVEGDLKPTDASLETGHDTPEDHAASSKRRRPHDPQPDAAPRSLDEETDTGSAANPADASTQPVKVAKREPLRPLKARSESKRRAPRAASGDADAATTIPFLRYRANVDDDEIAEESAAEIEIVSNPPTHAIAGDDAADAESPEHDDGGNPSSQT